MNTIEANKKDIIINSSIKISRNIKDLDFTDKLDKDIAKNNIEDIYEFILNSSEDQEFKLIRLWEDEENYSKKLVEMRLVTKDIINRKEKSAVLYNKDNTLSIMINGEDHIAIKCIMKGLNLKEEYISINRIDDIIEDNIQYAFHKEFGYLTASPNNIGTGLKARITMHLPALKINGKIEETYNELLKSGFILNGLYGNKDNEYSNMFTISNKKTLGVTEEDILKDLTNVIYNIILKEHENRDVLMSKYEIDMQDKVFRAYSILKNARMINEQELLELLSNVRFGIEIGMLDVDNNKIDEILISTRNAVIQSNYKETLSEKKKNIERARITRDILNSM